MKSIEITDKSNNKYDLRVDDGIFEKVINGSHENWEVKFELFDNKGGMFGQGKFKLVCGSEHEHLPNDKLLNGLINYGVKEISRSLENGTDVSSIGYTLTVHDCRK